MKVQTLLFRGSRERLRRNIEKKGGTLLPDRQFLLIWRSSYFRRGLAFRIRGRYERREEDILITYRFLPSAASVLWVSIPVLFLLLFALWECRNGNVDSAAAAAFFSLLYPAVAVWQAVRCHKEFRAFFAIPTR